MCLEGPVLCLAPFRCSAHQTDIWLGYVRITNTGPKNGRAYSFESPQVAESPQCAVLSSLAACSAYEATEIGRKSHGKWGNGSGFSMVFPPCVRGIEKLESQFRMQLVWCAFFVSKTTWFPTSDDTHLPRFGGRSLHPVLRGTGKLVFWVQDPRSSTTLRLP